MRKVSSLVIFLSAIALSAAQQAQWPACHEIPNEVEWFPHPLSCTEYIICFHGVMHNMTCAPGLHFHRNELKCMLPEEAECDINYMCPPEDDPLNPVFLPDPDDCGAYFVCSKGDPISRRCADGLWFDVVNRWCNWPEYVTCDDRTVITPGTTVAPQVPDISACNMHADLFDGDTYLKSMCIVSTSTNYENARQRCESMRMNLFIIDNSVVQREFFEATTWLLRNQRGGFVWINGRNPQLDGLWSVFTPAGTLRGPLYAGVDWVQTATINGTNSGECLRYTSQHGPYQAMGVVCNANSWFICEHGMQQSQPTTTQAMTTTTEDPIVIPPNPAVCWNATDLYSGNTYLKSMCIINTGVNYDTALTRCRANGMELFVINNFQEQAALREASRVIFATGHSRGFVWINGRLDDELCPRWYVTDPERREMFNGVHFLQTDTIHGATTGPCLRFSAQHTPNEWFAIGNACTASNWFICEFDRSRVAEPESL